MEEIRELISKGNTVTIRAKGNSMNPFIEHLRDSITLGPWKDEDIRKGCVALVKDNKGNYLVHRIIRREKETVTLIGDGNVGLYETAETDNIIGIMYSVTRKGKVWSTDSKVWKLYSWLWMFLLPVRRLPLGLWRRLFRENVYIRERRELLSISVHPLFPGYLLCPLLLSFASLKFFIFLFKIIIGHKIYNRLQR